MYLWAHNSERSGTSIIEDPAAARPRATDPSVPRSRPAVLSFGQGGDDVADLVRGQRARGVADRQLYPLHARVAGGHGLRSEEHTSELQSPCNLVCRLLLEKKKKLKFSYIFFKKKKKKKKKI